MAEEITKAEIEEEEIERDQYLVFKVREQQFGFQAMRIQEISPMVSITPVPNAPQHIEGIMNLRGKLASIINFRNKFGFEHKKYDEETRIIIVEYTGYPVGIIVDAVEEVMKITDDKVQKIPEAISSKFSDEFITGVAMLEKRVIALLDLDKVLTREEVMQMNKITEAIATMPPEVETKEKAASAAIETVESAAKVEAVKAEEKAARRAKSGRTVTKTKVAKKKEK